MSKMHDLNTACRLCFTSTGTFNVSRAPLLINVIKKLYNIEININDRYSKLLCDDCIKKVSQFDEHTDLVLSAQKIFSKQLALKKQMSRINIDLDQNLDVIKIKDEEESDIDDTATILNTNEFNDAMVDNDRMIKNHIKISGSPKKRKRKTSYNSSKKLKQIRYKYEKVQTIRDSFPKLRCDKCSFDVSSKRELNMHAHIHKEGHCPKCREKCTKNEWNFINYHIISCLISTKLTKQQLNKFFKVKVNIIKLKTNDIKQAIDGETNQNKQPQPRTSEIYHEMNSDQLEANNRNSIDKIGMKKIKNQKCSSQLRELSGDTEDKTIYEKGAIPLLLSDDLSKEKLFWTRNFETSSKMFNEIRVDDEITEMENYKISQFVQKLNTFKAKNQLKKTAANQPIARSRAQSVNPSTDELQKRNIAVRRPTMDSYNFESTNLSNEWSARMQKTLNSTFSGNITPEIEMQISPQPPMVYQTLLQSSLVNTNGAHSSGFRTLKVLTPDDLNSRAALATPSNQLTNDQHSVNAINAMENSTNLDQAAKRLRTKITPLRTQPNANNLQTPSSISITLTRVSENQVELILKFKENRIDYDTLSVLSKLEIQNCLLKQGVWKQMLDFMKQFQPTAATLDLFKKILPPFESKYFFNELKKGYLLSSY